MSCTLCPRKCSVNREKGAGYCGATDEIKIAKIMLHKWEEPCISAERGSGAIFFSGCPLKCVYCQNKEISHTCVGKTFSVNELSKAMLELQNMGAHNINLVSPTQYADKIRKAIDIIRDDIKIPIVYNTGGYELPEEIEKMRGYVDVFLTDIKYFSSELSMKYSKAKDYFSYAIKSLEKMLEVSPECVFDDDGVMKKGVILRHLVLPGCRKDSMEILDRVSKAIDVSKIKLSLMSQYTPDFCDSKYSELKRRITTFEYDSVAEKAILLGYDGYMQEKSSATKRYTPKFDA